MSYRGSRKHVLDWTGGPLFLDEMSDLLMPVPAAFPAEARFMPRGEAAPDEARLERFGPQLIDDDALWDELEDWWLCHKAGANTPNWDIAVECLLEDAPGIVLVEAKANWPELGVSGKPLSADASERSRENHERIGAAIDEACRGWQTLDTHVSISRDTHYQLANRLAFTWKLAILGVPTVLLYLGFTGDYGIVDAGAPFVDDADWQHAFSGYSASAWPPDLLDRRIDVGGTPVWVVSRSKPVIESSPPRSS
ncbi:MAG: hypothetical protein IBX63_11385 [Coriobacteriia bacterium]|nr:hypothetical protein [Coriobacteriia bacterium]